MLKVGNIWKSWDRQSCCQEKKGLDDLTIRTILSRPKGSIGLVLVLFSLVVLLFTSFSSPVTGGEIDIQSGHAYYAKLESISNSNFWAGLKIVNSGASLSESNLPFTSFPLSDPFIMEIAFPGANLKDDNHYYATMLSSTFDLTKIINVTDNDLNEEELFPSADFPGFYLGSTPFVEKNDGPYETFCCDKNDVTLGGRNFSAFTITLQPSTTYYLLKYNDSGTMTPLFLTPFTDMTCYNSTSCVSQFMLPSNASGDYNFYCLNKYLSYTYNIWIDGSSGTTFSQIALPYNLTVQVFDLYTGMPADDVDVLVVEEDGQNLFIPYQLSGYVSTAYTVGSTDASGYETFLIVPTGYPTYSTYLIEVGVLLGGYITSKETLYITSQDVLVRQSKPVSPTSLGDNAKTSTTTIQQIGNSLFTWANANPSQSKRYTITYNVGGSSWSYYNHDTGGTGAPTLKTGAPNVMTVDIVGGSGYSVRILEQGGYMIMNPYTLNSPLDAKTRIHSQDIPSGTNFIITPTSYGSLDSNVTLGILDGSGNIINSISLSIDSTLDTAPSGEYDSSGEMGSGWDLFKTISTRISQISATLAYALNN